MKKILLAVMIGLIAITTASAQKKKAYEKVYYQEVTKDVGPVTVTISNVVATAEYIKFKFHVKNNTTDFILLKTTDVIVRGDGKELKTTEKDLFIAPNDEESKVIDIKGSGYQFEKFTVEVGGLSRIPAKAKSEDSENFKLPVAKNEFDAGPFHILHLKNEKTTDLVAVKFTATYNGSKIGIINPGEAALLTPKGTEFANMGSKGQRKPFLLTKGESDNFTLYWKDIPVAQGDMQFANIEIIWNNAFVEATPEAVQPVTIEVAMDPGMTDAKNK